MVSLPPEQAQWARGPAPGAFSSSSLSLQEGVVHVWSARLDLPTEVIRQFEELLSPDEAARARRFVFEKTSRRFIAGRGLLRSILGWYAGRHPAELEFEYGPYGKPTLPEKGEGAWLRFNVSHSEGLALYAVAHKREVGVDVEYIRANLEYERIAARFFSHNESAALRALPEAQRCEAFFNCWTRKESFIKATGKGLMMPLDRFDVSLAPGEAAALLEVREEPWEASGWTISALDVGDGYAAALAVEGPATGRAIMMQLDAGDAEVLAREGLSAWHGRAPT